VIKILVTLCDGEAGDNEDEAGVKFVGAKDPADLRAKLTMAATQLSSLANMSDEFLTEAIEAMKEETL
jgi:hypothetical protein